ncbi:hypothetical protein ADICEAN_03217 [Cesiribacter andamanensis AMV16]|uniref:Uncharacterized protein n=2 Tax=Cesiribacter TaxID=1133570 RepID=M7MYV6_9BACT|nr:hypothetical protein ADICEAN_03217 [Cesiribacter andamanensis AMV16]
MGEALGSLSINLRQLPNLLRIFAANESNVQQMLPHLPYFSRLDALTASEGLLLTGFTQKAEEQTEDFLWTLHNQKPQPLRLDFLVPLRAASLLFVGVDHPQEWHRQLRSYWQKEGSTQWERWQVLEARAPHAASLLPLMGTQLGLATVPTAGSPQPDRLLIMHMPDSGATAAAMQELIRQLGSSDTLYSETFLRQQLQELPYTEFPAALLGSAYLGFSECYFTQVEEYLVLATSIPALKEMLLDVQAEETWQRSVRLNRFLSRLDPEQNYALYLNTTTLWPLLYRQMAGPWREFWDKHSQALRQVDLLSLQLSASEGAFYTNLFLHLDRRPERLLEQIQLSKKASTPLAAPLASAPQPVNYRQQRAGHWLVQDTARQLYLLDRSGQIVNSRPLGSFLQQGISELDPQKNKNPHYFFISRDSAYLLQPNLKSLKPFPMALPGGEALEWATVMDYDGSLRYRFLLASASGRLFMYDLDGTNLEGWQPKDLQGALSAAPGHMRVRSKDILYAFQKKGQIQAFTRRGEAYPGFPLNLGDSLLGPVHIRQGSDFKSTRFTTVTLSGLLYEWDLEGKVLSRRQLFRPDARARFYLVPDARGQRFIIVQQDRLRLRLLNENGSELFEKDYLGAGRMQVQYFPFADGAALIAVTDPEQEFTYLYDLKGNLLQTQPLNSCCPLSLQPGTAGDSLRVVKGYQGVVEQFLMPAIHSSN